ncbi:microsomal signal peptidase 25 kDa subunit [Diaporthe helianthi]|uniref:Signal peptidase complex subunit 2 n=1 Tax=Diaporthe helianthi TaxID=158607 RepID=A0A2P5I354_DIAHE|nr:microsomal signal peptidase 25 kDa subunit [Diaporthe helianthi]
MAVSAEKITLYNLADLKNTSDDALPNYLNSLGLKQSHILTDVRLALGYSAFLVAAACFLWDYKLGFESTKHYTAGAVAVYSLLNTALTMWMWLKEKGIVYVGTAPKGETVYIQIHDGKGRQTMTDPGAERNKQITIATHTKKNVPIYNLAITITPKTGSPTTINLSRSFTEWFDAAGRFVATPFQTMLASTVPVIGSLDPKRANAPTAESVPQYTDEELSAMLAAASASSDGTAEATGSSAKKGGKRRKA